MISRPALYSALKREGFALIHPEMPTGASAALRAWQTFLKAGTPHGLAARHGELIGYFPSGSERAVGSSSPDQKDFYQARDAGDLPRPLREPLAPLFNAAFVLAQLVADTLALGERGIDIDYRADRSGVVRLVRYPGNGSAAAHTDITLFTLLLGETESGLWIATPTGSTMTFPLPRRQVMIIAGDMLEIVTDGDIRACRHGALSQRERCSALFFANPRSDVLLRPGLTAGEALTRRLQEMR